jgi:hypothetical protein
MPPTYQNNILGIARDNLSALYQKQSRSENPNQKLIIGAGNSLASTNAANTNTLTDGQFFLAGDNGLKQALKTPLTYTAGSTERPTIVSNPSGKYRIPIP